jgi:chemotaxis protein MotB
MAKRKKKNDDEHMSESWLLPYSDLLTLLLALFIVLFSMSAVDAKKFQKFAQTFNDIFHGGTGVMDYSEAIPTPVPSTDGQSKNDDILNAKDENELKQVEGKINQYIKNKHLTNKITMSLTSEGLLLRIRDNVLFDSGKATIRKEDIQLARELSDFLVMNPPHQIVISGHTDNVPIKTAAYGSNWELSAMRAINFMKILLENPKLDPRLFSAKGYGEYQPIADNSTPEGRAKNRRVEVLIMPINQQKNAQQNAQQNAQP